MVEQVLVSTLGDGEGLGDGVGEGDGLGDGVATSLSSALSSPPQAVSASGVPAANTPALSQRKVWRRWGLMRSCSVSRSCARRVGRGAAGLRGAVMGGSLWLKNRSHCLAALFFGRTFLPLDAGRWPPPATKVQRNGAILGTAPITACSALVKAAQSWLPGATRVKLLQSHLAEKRLCFGRSALYQRLLPLQVEQPVLESHAPRRRLSIRPITHIELTSNSTKDKPRSTCGLSPTPCTCPARYLSPAFTRACSTR